MTGRSLPVPGDVGEALSELGIEYRVSGDEANAVCPNPKHFSSKPHWYCNLTTGEHICFSCGFSGSFARLVRVVRHMEEDEAELWVRTRSLGRLRAPADREEADAPVVQITEASLALFDPPPQRELDRRMISSDAAAELGILWDAEDRAWILPFRDGSGKLHGWQSKQTRGAKRVTNHPRGIRKASFLFGLHAQGATQCILVESPLDVARIRTAGPRGGVASYGVRVSGVQLDLIASNFESLVVALDNDEAGREESEKIRKSFRRIPVSFFNYEDIAPDVKDPGDMLDDEILDAFAHAIPALTARF